jgi:hypothetical protein
MSFEPSVMDQARAVSANENPQLETGGGAPVARAVEEIRRKSIEYQLALIMRTPWKEV